MSAIIQHITEFLEKKENAQLMSAIRAEETLSGDVQGQLKRIFVTPSFPLKAEASEACETAATRLEEATAHIKPPETAALRTEIELHFKTAMLALTTSPEWQTLLSSIPENNRALFAKYISAGFFFTLISRLCKRDPKNANHYNFILKVANSLNQSKKEDRSLALASTEDLVSATLCYFPVCKVPAANVFGHVAIGIRIENDLILCAAQPKLDELDKLPIGSKNNALIYVPTKNEVFYFCRSKNSLRSVLVLRGGLEDFKNKFIRETLGPGEKTKCLKQNLSFAELQEIQTLIPFPIEHFSEYYSYGDHQVSDELKDGNTFLSELAQNYDNKVRLITLPPQPRSKIKAAGKTFSSFDGSKYFVLSENCAQRVVAYMRDAGYDLSKTTFSNPLRPQAVAVYVCEMVQEKIKQERSELLSSNKLAGLNKITALIENDILRLEHQIKQDDISHTLLFKDPEKKRVKIKKLQALINELAAPDKDYETKFILIKTLSFSLEDKTAANLKECLQYFPYDKIEEYISKRKNFLIKFEEALNNNNYDLNPSILSRQFLGASTFKELFPAENTNNSSLDTLSAEKIDALYDAIFKKLSEEIKKPASADNKNLLAVYKAFHLMASVTVHGEKLTAPTLSPNNTEEESVTITIDATAGSFLNRSQTPHTRKTKKQQSDLDPTQWYYHENEPSALYQLIKENSPGKKTIEDFRTNLVRTLDAPALTQTTQKLTQELTLEKGDLLISTYQSTSHPFGLLEKCIHPHQELNSTLVLSSKVAAELDQRSDDLLQVIHQQIQRGLKNLRKKPRDNVSITIHSLNIDDLRKGTAVLTPLEKAYLSYCRSEGLTCKVGEGNKKIVLDKKAINELLGAVPDERQGKKIS